MFTAGGRCRYASVTVLLQRGRAVYGRVSGLWPTICERSGRVECKSGDLVGSPLFNV
jgi:hypothetical protein